MCRNLNKNTVNKFVVAVLTGAALLAGISCHRNPITGRNQLTLVSEKQVQALALTEYQKFLGSNKVVPATNADGEMVKRVGRRIADAIGLYYSDHGAPDALKEYTWEFNLVESKEVNAWCMPGGKVVVYTGLLPITQNETALAIVLGHEITGIDRESLASDLKCKVVRHCARKCRHRVGISSKRR